MMLAYSTMGLTRSSLVAIAFGTLTYILRCNIIGFLNLISVAI